MLDNVHIRAHSVGMVTVNAQTEYLSEATPTSMLYYNTREAMDMRQT